MKFSEVPNKLKMLEGYGFIKREIISMDDVPKFVWKLYSY